MGLLKLCLIGVFIGISGYFLRIYMKGSDCHLTNRIDGKDVLITGANTGIGLETAVELAARGGIIHMACRDQTKCQSAKEKVLERTKIDKNNVVTHILNLASVKSILTFVKSFKQKVKKLDILINNAGIMMCPYQETEDGFEMQIGVNHLGHFLLTNLLTDLLKLGSSPRIIIVSSSAHLFGTVLINDINLRGPDYGPISAYSLSKLANVLHAKSLSRRLRSDNIAVVSLHPGAVATELQRQWPEWMQKVFRCLQFLLVKNPREGAQTQICCAVNTNLMDYTGSYFNDCNPASSMNTQVYNETLSELIWQKSDALIKKAVSKTVII